MYKHCKQRTNCIANFVLFISFYLFAPINTAATHNYLLVQLFVFFFVVYIIQKDSTASAKKSLSCQAYSNSLVFITLKGFFIKVHISKHARKNAGILNNRGVARVKIFIKNIVHL